MRKALLLTLALLFSLATSAQSVSTFVSESFDGSDIPLGWSTAGEGTDNWKISLTTYSGGDGNELKLSWDPKFEGTARLITKPFNLSDVEEITVSFKHFFDNFRDNEFKHKIGIATSTDGTTWNEGWSQEYTLTGVYDVKVQFSTPDMGKENVMFCLFYEGISQNMDNWFFDDLLIYKQTELDLRIIDIDLPEMIETGEREISFTVENMGTQAVESFEARINASNWETADTVTFTQNINNSEIVQITYKDRIFNALAKGTPYRLSVDILSINGTDDQDPSNSSVKKNVYVAFNKAQRVPMIEHFSSSTCGPCVSVNQEMHSLMQANEGKYTYTKFPTAGDPYHDFESAYRVQEYGVTGVPNIFLDGSSNGSKYLTQENLNERYNTPAYADIRGAFSLDGDVINITADFMSYIELNNVLAFVTVNEKTTTKNTGTNGEKEFHHILMKMLKSKTGNTVSIKAGEYQRLEFSHNMSLTHVEELEDLEVALWLQNPETKEIYNSRFAYAYAEHCYPIQNLTLNQNENEKTLTWEAPEKGAPVSYTVIINGKLVSENKSTLSYSFTSEDDTFTAEVIAVYENEKTSVSVAKLFGEVEEYFTLETPKNLTATSDTSSITLQWNAVENALSYNVYSADTLVANVTETTYTVTGLTPETEYSFTVTAVRDEQESAKSDIVTINTLKIGTDALENLTSSFKIYPNPVNDKLFIETEVEIMEVSVYDVYGRKLSAVSYQLSAINGQQSLSIDVNELNSGVYFVKVVTSEGELVKRFIKK